MPGRAWPRPGPPSSNGAGPWRVTRADGLAELELAALSQLTSALSTQQGFVGAAFDLMRRAELQRRPLESARFRVGATVPGGRRETASP